MFAVLMMSGSLLLLTAASPIPNYWFNPVASMTALNQYHAQDGSGSYRYGYTGPYHAKMETRSNGVTQGGYSYIDANGILQTVAYSADDVNGFRVKASNLPQQPENLHPVSETPEVAAARRRHLEEFEKIAESNVARDTNDPISSNSHNEIQKHTQIQRDTSNSDQSTLPVDYQRGINDLANPFLLTGAEAARIDIPRPDPTLLKNAANRRDDSVRQNEETGYTQYENQDGPTRVVPLPNIQRNLVAPAGISSSYVLPIVPYRLLHSSLHHTQDSLGQYDYSYVGDTSSKTESRSLDGTTRGAYSYVDANGLLQQVHYIADHNGFRVLATNLPEA